MNPNRPFIPEEYRHIISELREVYGKDFRPFAGSHHARFLPADVPIHVISRVFQGRYLLTPTKRLRSIIAGVIGKAQRQYPDVKLFAKVFMSNHMHMMMQGPAAQTAAFIGYVKNQISLRWGKEPSVKWPGKMWEHYISTALPTAQSQIRCLKYILSHGVKEGLVAKPQLWPGVHSAKQLLTGNVLQGEWLDGTTYGRLLDVEKRKRPERRRIVPMADHIKTFSVKLEPIPPWEHLDELDYRAKIRSMVEEIEVEGRGRRDGRQPLGVKKILATPRNKTSKLPKQPWFTQRKKMICWSDPRDPATRAFLDRHWDFQRAYRAASEAFRSHTWEVAFPAEAFRPSVWPPGRITQTRSIGIH